MTNIGWPEHLYRDRFGRVLNRNGELVHIVHQYDRRKRLVASLGKRYALVDRPEPPPRTAAPVDTAAPFAGGGWLRGGAAGAERAEQRGLGGRLARRAQHAHRYAPERDNPRADGRIGVDADNLAP